MADEAERIKQLEERVREQARQLGFKDETLHRKNLELDALHYVWCDGNCERGVHRYGEHPPLTEELVAAAERAVRRMRNKLANLEYARKHYRRTPNV